MLTPEQVKTKRDTALYWQKFWEEKQNYIRAEIHRKEVDLLNEVLEGNDEHI